MILLTINAKGGECFTETNLTDVVKIWELLDRIIPNSVFYIVWENIPITAYKFINGQIQVDTDKLDKVYRLGLMYVQLELF